jgi:AraC-like DNA-binding protein
MHSVIQHRSVLSGVEARTLSTDRQFPRHSHDQFGIGLMAFGAHRSWSGVGQVVASAGDVIMVNPGEVHDGSPVERGRARGWRMLYFDPALLEAELRDEVAGPLELARPVAGDRPLAARIARLFEVVTAEQPPDPAAVEEQLLVALTDVLTRHGLAKPAAEHRTPPVDRALRHLHDVRFASVSLAELARLSGVSRFQLLRAFARELGITPHAYVIEQRVLIARSLLAAGLAPVEAAIEAGFADQSHMTRAFVRQMGVTPARYRAAVSPKGKRNFVQERAAAPMRSS